MKKRGMFIGLLLVLTAMPVKAETSITIAADEWCPYNCEPDSAQPGFMIEIARQAFEPEGITVKYVVVPWSRAISKTREGKYDAIVGATSGDAPDFIFPTVPQGLSIMGFFTLPDSGWFYKNQKSLGEVSFGAISDYSYSDALDAYIKKYAGDRDRVQLVSGEKALAMNIRKLLNRRVDAVVDDANVLANYMEKNNQKQPLRLAGMLHYNRGYDEQLVYIAFGPKNPSAKAYAALLSARMKELRASGKLNTILARYGLKDWYEMTKK